VSDFDLDRYKRWAKAYPESIFTPMDGDPVKKTGDYDTKEKRRIMTKASGLMGRHMAESALLPLIAEIERLNIKAEVWESAAREKTPQGSLAALSEKCDVAITAGQDSLITLSGGRCGDTHGSD
jgi:hypothetical protein